MSIGAQKHTLRRELMPPVCYDVSSSFGGSSVRRSPPQAFGFIQVGTPIFGSTTA
ncbi:MAG: hypothetical protein JW885_08395 [Deltaproteobacteria bacterium]|nr:hypothetical protein [Candidatus Zymogenaceae bacterium]